MKKRLWLGLTIGIVFFLAACGSNEVKNPNTGNTNSAEETENSSSPDQSVNNEINITAANFNFDQSEYTVTSGEKVKITLTNQEGYHGVAINEFDVNIQGDGGATFTPEEPGEYTIYCSVPCGEGHADMKSTLIVK